MYIPSTSHFNWFQKKVNIFPEPTIGHPYLLHPPELQDFDLSKVLNLGGQEWSPIRAGHTKTQRVLEPFFSGGGGFDVLNDLCGYYMYIYV